MSSIRFTGSVVGGAARPTAEQARRAYGRAMDGKPVGLAFNVNRKQEPSSPPKEQRKRGRKPKAQPPEVGPTAATPPPTEQAAQTAAPQEVGPKAAATPEAVPAALTREQRLAEEIRAHAEALARIAAEMAASLGGGESIVK